MKYTKTKLLNDMNYMRLKSPSHENEAWLKAMEMVKKLNKEIEDNSNKIIEFSKKDKETNNKNII